MSQSNKIADFSQEVSRDYFQHSQRAYFDNFYELPVNFKIARELGYSCAFLYAVICFYSNNKNHSCFAKDAGLAAAVGLSIKSIERILLKLEEVGLIFRNTWYIPNGQKREIVPVFQMAPYINKIYRENFRKTEIADQIYEHLKKHDISRFFRPGSVININSIPDSESALADEGSQKTPPPLPAPVRVQTPLAEKGILLGKGNMKGNNNNSSYNIAQAQARIKDSGKVRETTSAAAVFFDRFKFKVTEDQAQLVIRWCNAFPEKHKSLDNPGGYFRTAFTTGSMENDLNKAKEKQQQQKQIEQAEKSKREHEARKQRERIERETDRRAVVKRNLELARKFHEENIAPEGMFFEVHVSASFVKDIEGNVLRYLDHDNKSFPDNLQELLREWNAS